MSYQNRQAERLRKKAADDQKVAAAAAESESGNVKAVGVVDEVEELDLETPPLKTRKEVEQMRADGTLTHFYASQFPDIAQAEDVNDIPPWALQFIRRSNTGSRYLFVGGTVDEEAGLTGVYHVRELGDGPPLVTRVSLYRDQITKRCHPHHDEFSVEQSEIDRALKVYRLTEEFAGIPGRSLFLAASAANKVAPELPTGTTSPSPIVHTRARTPSRPAA
jgi:hypothetical protein